MVLFPKSQSGLAQPRSHSHTVAAMGEEKYCLATSGSRKRWGPVFHQMHILEGLFPSKEVWMLGNQKYRKYPLKSKFKVVSTRVLLFHSLHMWSESVDGRVLLGFCLGKKTSWNPKQMAEKSHLCWIQLPETQPKLVSAKQKHYF